MAEPLAIIGLVSSIITFIEFSSKLISTAKRLRDNPDEPVTELERLEQTKQHVKHLKNAFEKESDGFMPQDIQEILWTAGQCESVAADLIAILQRLKGKDGSSFKTLDAISVAMLAFWKKKPIDNLQNRLEKLETKLRGAVNQVLQQRQHTVLMEEIGMLQRLHLNMAVNYEKTLDSYQTDILNLNSPGSYNVLDRGHLDKLNNRLHDFEQECKDRRHTGRVLSRLDFPEIRRRWNKIHATEKSTNTWIFDRQRTNFPDWLESRNDIFWITGKAGSGKSTLMKFISDHSYTREALEHWANGDTLHVTSYYFWNQGSPLQKSLRGLLRTILFNILKTTPSIVPKVCPELPDGDWTDAELKEMLERLTKLENIQAKLCFFIDGLDEFGGEEIDLKNVLKFFNKSLHVKLCVSSRPRIILDDSFRNERQCLTISDFTAGDMKHYVRMRFKAKEFDKLRSQQGGEEECENIMSKIAESSKGVWLWVYLVTHDLMRAAATYEKPYKLHEILDQFPKGLEEYFKYIIDQIEPHYREEMAQIFLITIDEVQPLPVFLFSLLQREKKNENYAIDAPIKPLDFEAIDADRQSMRALVHNRCGDLLVVEDGKHPVILSHPVDFLHRTVRDFLRDCYYDQLKSQLKRNFDPLVSLCNMMLFLVKGLPAIKSITQLFQIVDELLYYANEIEKRSPSQAALDHLASVLDELDTTNTKHHGQSMSSHWTSIRDPLWAKGNDQYLEGGKCNFLALVIQARLRKYVTAKITQDPSRLRKPGRPLLDYALRPRRKTALTMPYHSQRDEAGIDIEIITLFLDQKACPNEPVHLNDGRTVWALFLMSMNESSMKGEVSTVTKQVWYNVCESLIRHGAEPDCQLHNDGAFTVEEVLKVVFGADRAAVLLRLLAEEKVRRRNSSWGAYGAYLLDSLGF
ncbi:uncharacterized protein B0J16DRAFT_307950 [Fusarium flagelliforme]|uniref:uncharacterized protein n=1 Tax=Fusarium flagelliforme TaxID=2675880 RepID=UPI001E8E9C9D|nr:uncharacterized protein B0J16DRAFT_307950 [Fusarium flagelliforme]KAH7183607.1 hypothetical protein B0J16DRAFT_307950 [Fusarium flagelliforme]